MDYVQRYMKLFHGNQRSYGVWNKKTGKVKTEKEQVTRKQYDDHINGVVGLGLVPILDEGTCWFGAIDIDAHGDAPDIDLVELEAMVRDKDLPLMVCRSKSGGAHLYVFGSEPLPAKLLRHTLAKWAARLGHKGCEIFPKQDSLLEDAEGERQLGNWINLPWFDAMNPECNRYAVEGGDRIDFGYFLDLAESRRVSAARLVELGHDEHEDAPPCIQKIISGGVSRGQRNEALYNVVVYLKKAFPETWKDKAFDLNSRIFPDPLPFAEAKKTIASAGRRDYKYRCKEEPCRSLCQSSLCVTRKYGITPDDKSELEMGEQLEFGPLEKINTTPPKWVLHVGGAAVDLTTTELMDFRYVRIAVAEKLTKLIPPMKNEKWQVMLHDMMNNTVEIEAPDDASVGGLIKRRLYEFLGRTDLTVDGEIQDRQNLLLGMPVVQTANDGSRRVFFRGSDFVDYLRKSRSEELKGPNLWMALRDMGVEHGRMRVGKTVVPVWSAPLTEEHEIEFVDVNMEPEI